MATRSVWEPAEPGGPGPRSSRHGRDGCFRRVFVDFGGAGSLADLAIASLGRSYEAVFTADGPSKGPKHGTSGKNLDFVRFCSHPAQGSIVNVLPFVVCNRTNRSVEFSARRS